MLTSGVFDFVAQSPSTVTTVLQTVNLGQIASPGISYTVANSYNSNIWKTECRHV